MDFTEARAEQSPYQPWKIYPKPPPPHWGFGAKKEAVTIDGRVDSDDGEFEVAKCDVPGSQDWIFELDDKGVYQVYPADGGLYPSEFAFSMTEQGHLCRTEATFRYPIDS